MAKKEKDPNYELRFKEIQKEFNNLCYRFGEEQMKNFAFMNFVIMVGTYPDPSELKPREVKAFASKFYNEAQRLCEALGLPKWSWEKEDGKETEDENAV